MTDKTGVRCDTPLDEEAALYIGEGGPAQCPRCGIPFEIEEEWLVENGAFIRGGRSV